MAYLYFTLIRYCLFWGTGNGGRGGGGLFSQILYNLVTFYGEILFVSFL